MYNIGNWGYCPFLLFAGGSFYFLDIRGIEVENELSNAGVKLTEISDVAGILDYVSAIKDESVNPERVRIKIALTNAANFIGIIPMRIDTIKLLGHYQSEK